MISDKFSAVSDELLGRYLEDLVSPDEEKTILESVSSITDLWVLKKMYESINDDDLSKIFK